MRLTIFLVSCLLSFVGGHMVNYSIIFLAIEWFDSHAIAGIGYGLCFGPPLILGWFAGIYCDKYSPKRVLLVAQNSFFVSITLLWLAAIASAQWQLPTMLLAAFFSGVAWSFVAPARFASLPLFASNTSLAGATIALNLMVMAGFGLAPVVLKQLLSVYEWQVVFAVSASLFFVSSALLLLLSADKKDNVAVNLGETSFSLKREMVNTLSLISSSVYLSQLLLLAGITYLLMGPMQVLLPTIAEQTLELNDVAQGNYLSLIAIALFVGGVVAMALKSTLPFGKTILLTIAGAGVGLGAISYLSTLTMSVISLLLAGICGGIAVSFIAAGLQHIAPDEHRGKVMSVYSIIGQVIPAASGIAAGVFADLFNTNTALMLMALIIVIATLLAIKAMTPLRALSRLQDAQKAP